MELALEPGMNFDGQQAKQPAGRRARQPAGLPAKKLGSMADAFFRAALPVSKPAAKQHSAEGVPTAPPLQTSPNPTEGRAAESVRQTARQQTVSFLLEEGDPQKLSPSTASEAKRLLSPAMRNDVKEALPAASVSVK